MVCFSYLRLNSFLLQPKVNRERQPGKTNFMTKAKENAAL
jgi:hypothetical protein